MQTQSDKAIQFLSVLHGVPTAAIQRLLGVPVPPTIADCKECGKLFQKRNTWHEFCNGRCHYLHRRKSRADMHAAHQKRKAETTTRAEKIYKLREEGMTFKAIGIIVGRLNAPSVPVSGAQVSHIYWRQVRRRAHPKYFENLRKSDLPHHGHGADDGFPRTARR